MFHAPDSGTKPTSKGDSRPDMDGAASEPPGHCCHGELERERKMAVVERSLRSLRRHKMEMEHNILEPGANEDGTEWNREWNGREQAPVIKKCGRRGKETRKKKEEGGNGDVKKFPFSSLSLSLSFGLKARKWRKKNEK